MSHRIGKVSGKRAKHQVTNFNGGTPRPCKKVVLEATRSLVKNSTTKGNCLSTSSWAGVLKDPNLTTVIWVRELSEDTTDLVVGHGDIHPALNVKLLSLLGFYSGKQLNRLLEEPVTDSLVQL